MLKCMVLEFTMRYLVNNTWRASIYNFFSSVNSIAHELDVEEKNFVSSSNHVLFCVSHKHKSLLLTRKVNFIKEWK